MRKIVLAVVVLGLIAAIQLLAQGKLPSTCPSGTTSHFPGAATSIDSKCGLQGTPSADMPGEGPQNKVKNNFCSQSDSPAPITLSQIASLQGDAEKKEEELGLKPGEPPQNRDFLAPMGEGNLVVFEGYVFEARQECKESVNCGTAVPNKNAFHDIHIAILGTPRQTSSTSTKAQENTEECTGFVAEMIPHHRPAEWNACNVNAVGKKGLRVRVTGQQFFDGSHVPCKDGAPQGDNPKRVSLWEIHPIYAFEICPKGDCADGGWVPLQKYDAGNFTCAEAKCE